MGDIGSKPIDPLVEPLTRREREVLALLEGDLTSREIAEKLTIAASSARWHIQQIYGKLGVHSRRQATARARALGLLESVSSPVSQPDPRHNLPHPLTRFIGREQEIAQVKELLEEQALITLTGSGGVGKTRLALRVTEQVLERFPDGAWLVDLAPLSDPGLVLQRVATALGLGEDANRPLQATMVDYLRGKEALLVLDNCEHLSAACARLADQLLQACPQVRLLATSRELLGVSGERPYRVPSMNFPDPHKLRDLANLQEYDAIRLLVERAQAVMPDFQVTEQNRASLVQICQRLDGIPLALELAAARMGILTTEQLAQRLDDAFHLLTSGSRTALPRHQTLRAAIDWSFNLLSEQERIVLRRLSVFAGGASLEAIEAVCAGQGIEPEEILDTLSSLVNKSIVNAERRQGVETRYRLLETVRQYAREKLSEANESQTFHGCHLDYFLALAEEIEPQLRTPIALERLQVLHREADNFRAALSWALDDPGRHKIEAGLRLASALLNFWHTQSFHNEGYTWLNKGLSLSPPVLVDLSVRAKACFSAGHLILALGRTAEARQWFEDSLDIFQRIDDPGGVGMAQSMLGEVAAWSGSFEEARQLGEAGLAICRSLNDTWLLAWALCRIGMSFFYLQEGTLSRPLLEESLAIFEHLGDPLQVADHFITLGALAYNRGDLSEASGYYQKALANAQARQSKWTEAIVLRHLSMVAYEKDEYQQMLSFLQKSILIQRENARFPRYEICLTWLGIAEINLGLPEQALNHLKEGLQIATQPDGIVSSLIGIARAALQMSQPWIAAQLLGACQRYMEVEDRHIGRVNQKEYERGWAEAKARLDEPAFEKAIAEGQAMTLDEAVKQALSLSFAEPMDR